MKFTCDKSVLQNACFTASRAVASKSPIPALEGVYLEAGESLKVTGYDLKKAIYTTVDADIAETGEIVLNSRLLGEMLRRLPDGLVTVRSDEKLNVNIKCGKSNYNIVGISASDYPELPRMDETNCITTSQQTLKKMIQNTLFCVSNNDMRPVYTGILFDVAGNELNLVSVDGYRLARRYEYLETEVKEDCSFVVPGNTLSDVEKICADSDDKLKISVGEKHICFYIGETVVISRRLEGDFLNYRRSIPQNFKYTIKVEKANLMASVDRVSLIINEKTTIPVRVCFGDGTIRCSCITAVGNAEDICLCEGNGDDLEIGFNDKYMMDAMKNSLVSEIEICVNNAASPCVIRAADGSGKFVYMILPVRLRAGE